MASKGMRHPDFTDAAIPPNPEPRTSPRSTRAEGDSPASLRRICAARWTWSWEIPFFAWAILGGGILGGTGPPTWLARDLVEQYLPATNSREVKAKGSADDPSSPPRPRQAWAGPDGPCRIGVDNRESQIL